MTRVTLKCKECGMTARRALLIEAGVRGVHETCCEIAMCPRGHGEMERLGPKPFEVSCASPKAHVRH